MICGSITQRTTAVRSRRNKNVGPGHWPSNPQISVGGKPLHSWPAFIPVTFELTILGAATAALLGMILLNGLPELYHPVFNLHSFGRASQDRFFLAIETKDPKFDLKQTRAFLENLHAVEVSEVEN